MFTAFVGPISQSSVACLTCHDPECVNPFHVTVMTRKEARERAKGTWQPRMIAPEGRVVSRIEYEATLCDTQVKEKRRKAALLVSEDVNEHVNEHVT